MSRRRLLHHGLADAVAGGVSLKTRGEKADLQVCFKRAGLLYHGLADAVAGGNGRRQRGRSLLEVEQPWPGGGGRGSRGDGERGGDGRRGREGRGAAEQQGGRETGGRDRQGAAHTVQLGVSTTGVCWR